MLNDELRLKGNAIITDYMEGDRDFSNGIFWDVRWDWLMNVVYKIDSEDRFSNEQNGKIKQITNNRINTDIETIWLLVFEYIEWYNLQNK